MEMIVLDIDGTLINDNNQILKQTQEVITQAQQDHKKIVLASGRPTKGILQFSKKLKIKKDNGFIISYNGAKVTDISGKEIFLNETIEKKLSHKILTRLESFDVITFIDNDEYLFVKDAYDDLAYIDDGEKKINIIKSERDDNELKLCEFKRLYDYNEDLNKILVAADRNYLKKHLKKIIEPFQHEINAEFSADYILEITKKNVHKANGLEIILSKLKIERNNVIAFGDGENDISMLEYVGVGVAMGNANNKVKKHADIITTDNNKSGIAEIIEKYVLS